MATVIAGLALRVDVGLAQQQVFRTGVAAVPLNVRVSDQRGRPITGLQKSDFRIVEDGVPQALTAFEPYELVADRSNPCRTVAAAKEMSAESRPVRRVFLIAVDTMWLPMATFGTVEATTSFLRERLLPQDYAGLVIRGQMTGLTCDHESLARALERWRDFQASLSEIGRVGRDKYRGFDSAGSYLNSQAAAIVADVQGVVRQLPPPMPELQEIVKQVLMRPNPIDPSGRSVGLSYRMTDVLGAVQSLRGVEGEKHLIFPFGDAAFPSADDDRSIAKIASDARVAIHSIKADGLSATAQMWSFREQSLRLGAALTGGSAFIDRSPSEAFAAIDSSTRSGYFLAYSPSDSTGSSANRRVLVSVPGRKDAQVSARRSYSDSVRSPEDEFTFFAAQDQILERLRRDAESPELGIQATVAVRGKLADVDVQIDLGQIQLALQDERRVGKVEIAAFALDDRQRLVGEQWHTVALNLKDETWKRLLRDGFSQKMSVATSGAAARVKVIVYDYGSGLTGLRFASKR